MYGVGYPVLERAVAGHYFLVALIGLLAAKLLATSLTMWIGGSGGVFAPSLFMGAMLGTAYGIVAHHLLPHLAVAPGAYGLVGMGAVFAGAARAPITAVIIVFELTGDYNVILPVMFAIVVATALGNRLTRDTIYTLKLRRRGIDIDAPKGAPGDGEDLGTRGDGTLAPAAAPRAARLRDHLEVRQRAIRLATGDRRDGTLLASWPREIWSRPSLAARARCAWQRTVKPWRRPRFDQRTRSRMAWRSWRAMTTAIPVIDAGGRAGRGG